jgi:hypothetical protein
MIHIIVGEESAAQLRAAFELDENLSGEILVLQDQLGIGPIAVHNQQSHDPVRRAFWKLISPHHHIAFSDDYFRVEAIIEKAQQEEEPCCFWLSPSVHDICAYYWLMRLFKPYPDVLHTINIIGLPFLNEKGQLFYPKSFTEVIPKEFIKTKRLLKKVTLAEYEVEADEWLRLQQEDQWVRTGEGGKKIQSRPLHYYDAHIISSIGGEFQKGSKIISEAMKKSGPYVLPAFLEWRLREIIQQHDVEIKGDTEKPTKEFEIRMAGKPEMNVTEAAAPI